MKTFYSVENPLVVKKGEAWLNPTVKDYENCLEVALTDPARNEYDIQVFENYEDAVEYAEDGLEEDSDEHYPIFKWQTDAKPRRSSVTLEDGSKKSAKRIDLKDATLVSASLAHVDDHFKEVSLQAATATWGQSAKAGLAWTRDKGLALGSNIVWGIKTVLSPLTRPSVAGAASAVVFKIASHTKRTPEMLEALTSWNRTQIGAASEAIMGNISEAVNENAKSLAYIGVAALATGEALHQGYKLYQRRAAAKATHDDAKPATTKKLKPTP